MRLASRSASLMARMAVICEPMWKCRSCRQSSIPTPRSFSTVSTSSEVVSPNFERSPVDSTHLPAPRVERRALTPMIGLMPRSRLAAMMVSTSATRSTTMMTFRPSFCASIAVSM